MVDNKLKEKITVMGYLVTLLFGLPWLEILAELWQLSRKLWRGLAYEGMYEVLEHEVTLELLDDKGKQARIQKRQKVRYLQNNIIAYQDQAWGVGKSWSITNAARALKRIVIRRRTKPICSFPCAR